MKLGLSNKLLTSPINSVPLSERASLGVSFDRSRYTNPAGFARQQSVGSSNILLQSYAGPSPVFSRATSGTFLNSAGLIERAPENLLSYSEQFDNPVWNKFRTSISSTSVLSPRGDNTADLVVSTSSTFGTHAIGQASLIVLGSTYTMTVFAKAAGYNRLMMSTFNSQAVPTNSTLWYFDLVNGQIVGTVNWVSASITPVGGGWFRCSGTFVGISNNTTDGVGLYALNDSGLLSFNGDGVSGINFWGAQLERHTSARPYISTTSAAVYGPRFEYDTNGEPLGLLMEEQSTNLLQYSEQFDNVSWMGAGIKGFVSGSVANTTSTTDPSGRNNADSIQALPGGGQHNVQQGPVSSTAGSLTFSVFLKKNNNNWIGLGIYDNAWRVAAFNVQDGLIGTSISSGVTASISSEGNGWYRCSITYTTALTSVYGGIFLLPSDTTSLTWVSAGTESIYIWGAQLEAKPFATSYIPTVGGTATRNADVLSLPVGTWYDPNAGTIQFEGDRIASPDSNAQGFDSFFTFYSDLAAYNVLTHIGASGYEQFEAALDGFGTSAYTYIGTEIAPNTPIKLAVTYDSPPLSASSYYASVNGSEAVSTSGADPLETPDVLKLGSVSGNSVLFGPLATSYFNGHIKSFTYTTKFWPDKIQALTA